VGTDITVLSNGNYVVGSPGWNGNRGAATWANGATGLVGVVSDANSLVGSSPGEYVGENYAVTALSNGNYVVGSPGWNGNRGAATWANGATGLVGLISAANSLVGSSPGDLVGGVFPFSNGNYMVLSSHWNGGLAAVTWADGTSGRTVDGTSVVSPQNSFVGQVPATAYTYTSVVILEDPLHQAFIVRFYIVRIGTGPGDPTSPAYFSSGFTDPNQLTFARGESQTITVTPAFLTQTLNTGTAVVLQASNDITVNSPITVSAGGQGGDLTLQAGRSILLNASISTDNGNLTLIANDVLANGVIDAQRDPGNAVISMAAGTTLDAGSGAVTVELRPGTGKAHPESGGISLQSVHAASLTVRHQGPSVPGDLTLGGTIATYPGANLVTPAGTVQLTSSAHFVARINGPSRGSTRSGTSRARSTWTATAAAGPLWMRGSATTRRRATATR
jgi:hypothetical protein